MKLIICAKYHVNQMTCVESRRGPIDPPPPLSVCVHVTIIFFSRLLGLRSSNQVLYNFTKSILSLKGASQSSCSNLLYVICEHLASGNGVVIHVPQLFEELEKNEAKGISLIYNMK